MESFVGKRTFYKSEDEVTNITIHGNYPNKDMKIAASLALTDFDNTGVIITEPFACIVATTTNKSVNKMVLIATTSGAKVILFNSAYVH